ncbi:ester cyclase [Niabella sp.]|uniref:ester cyclase n=1 Tax=Niabella sp. TaxID=1962976 RepID=UPI002626EDA9|nr:ester cyclase [Niabella sp.]
MQSETATICQKLAVVAVMLLGFPAFLYAQAPLHMSSNKKAIQLYFSEVINKHDLSKLKPAVAVGYVWHAPDGGPAHRAADSAHFKMLQFVFSAIPDIQYSIDNMIEEGDLVAVNTWVTGTANKEFFGFPPGKKTITFRQMFFFRLKNQKIAEEWEVLDMGGIRDQLSKN